MHRGRLLAGRAHGAKHRVRANPTMNTMNTGNTIDGLWHTADHVLRNFHGTWLTRFPVLTPVFLVFPVFPVGLARSIVTALSPHIKGKDAFGIAGAGGKDGELDGKCFTGNRDPAQTLIIVIHTDLFPGKGYLVSPFSSSRPQGNSSSAHPCGKPLYPVERMRFCSSTMQQPT